MTSVNSAADVTYGADAANRIVWNWQHQRRGTLQTIIEATPERRHWVDPSARPPVPAARAKLAQVQHCARRIKDRQNLTRAQTMHSFQLPCAGVRSRVTLDLKNTPRTAFHSLRRVLADPATAGVRLRMVMRRYFGWRHHLRSDGDSPYGLRHLVGAMALALLAPVLHAEEANCSVAAWVTDDDPAGLNVRARPDARSPVLARLKPTVADAKVTVSAVAVQSGWVKIGAAHSGDIQIFADEGWVSSKWVAATLAKDRTDSSGANQVPLRLRPTLHSPRAGVIEAGLDVRLLGVRCGWVNVARHDQHGWVRSGQLCTDAASRCRW